MATLLLNNERVDIRKSLFALDKADCEESLSEFIKQAWHAIEPHEYIHNWHIDMIAEHLTAITDEMMIDDEQYYNRLCINVCPGAMKSLLVGVMWPAWELGPRNMPYTKYVCASHSLDLAIRDNVKCRRLIQSEWYQERWGDRVKITGDQNAKGKFETTAGGFRQAVALTGMTGARGDRVIIDDGLSVDGAQSDAIRQSTIETFLTAVPTRLNSPEKSAIIQISQRLHEEDLTGVIMDKKLGYDWIMIPMEYDPERAAPTMLGASDPRTVAGELYFPARFPAHVVERDKKIMGSYAVSGQFQQQPSPQDGGIIKRDHWQLWPNDVALPAFDYIIASLDTAYTTKTENDFSAMTVWGVFSEDPIATASNALQKDGKAYKIERTYKQPHPKVMMVYAWQERLQLNDLVTKVANTMKMMQAETILIENKAAGIPVAQELRRLYSNKGYQVILDDPKSLDKIARLYSIQHLFEDGLIYAPDKTWVDQVITQCMMFPKGKHDDLCLVGETLILMADGTEKRIDEIRAGEYVKTKNGFGRVSASAMTGVKPIWKLSHTNGELYGTHNHPIYSNGEYIPLSSCKVGDKLETSYQYNGVTSWLLEKQKIQNRKQSSLTEENITDILNQKLKPIKDIFQERGIYCIETSGNFIMEKFQTAIKYTMLIGTRSIMTYPIYNACPEKCTVKNIMKNTLLVEKAKHKLNIFQKLEKKQKLGIKVLKGANGIVKMLLQVLKLQMLQNHIAKVTMLDFANGVDQSLKQKAPKKLCVQAHVPIKKIDSCEVLAINAMNITRQVYNLTVEGEHCYYANGILTHNCDTVSSALRFLRKAGMMERAEEVQQSYEDLMRRPTTQPAPLYSV